ncbi:MAG: putative prokaryotic signal transducing protein [Verrucomicrobiota bacterium]|jgi:Putative prokaryotic signal transducing protein
MKLVTLFSSFSQPEAQLVRARLEAAEFHPFIANENAPCTLGGFSKSTLIRVEIPEAEFADAKEFLDTPVE